MTRVDLQTPLPEARAARWPWVLVVVTTLLALAAAAIYLSTRTSEYEATANVLVSPVGSEDLAFQGLPLIRESSDGARPVQTGVGLLSGPQVAKLTAARLGSGATVKEVEGEVAVLPRGESNIVAITATTDSAAEAAQVATTYAKAALELRARALRPAVRREIEIGGDAERVARLRLIERTGDPTLSLAAAAERPSGSSDLAAKMVLVLAAVIGLLGGLGLVVLVNVARGPEPRH
jgi:capsular polysaccharide biosynthesis protein